MPRGDGTGPIGGNFGGGRGGGRGRGLGGGRGGGFGLGPGGNCLCPACGATVPHQVAVPCYQVKCPKCGQPMTRQR